MNIKLSVFINQFAQKTIVRQTSNSPGYRLASVSGTEFFSASDNPYIGCLNCAGSDISYLIQSARLTMSPSPCISNSISIASLNPYYTSPCGNMVRDSGEGCDDANVISGDGCSELCVVESGWSCNGGTPTTKDTCEICGDGKSFTSLPTFCDDGNNNNDDGCSSTCTIETGYSCSGGSSTSKDKCFGICGDGIRVITFYFN